jgi:hypothetical protein
MPVPVTTAETAKSEVVRNLAFEILSQGAADGAGGGVDPTPGLSNLTPEYQKETKDYIEAVALGVIRGVGVQILQVTNLFNNSDATGNPASKVTPGFTTTAGTKLIVFASGSGYHAAGSAVIGVDLRVDAGATFGTVKVFVNEASSHKAFIPGLFVVTGLSAGAHTITATKLAGTLWDASDFLNITIVEVFA